MMSSVATVHDSLVVAYSQNIIDDVELALLYDANISKPVFPYSKYERFNIDNWEDQECWTKLRFGTNDLESLRNNLHIPDEIVCSRRTVCDAMEGMCILLKRLAYPCRYTDMVPHFGRNPTELCLILNSVLDFINLRHRHQLRNWGMNPFLQPGDIHRYAEAIYQHGAPLQNCFGLIDGTM